MAICNRARNKLNCNFKADHSPTTDHFITNMLSTAVLTEQFGQICSSRGVNRRIDSNNKPSGRRTQNSLGHIKVTHRNSEFPFHFEEELTDVCQDHVLHILGILQKNILPFVHKF